MPQTLAGRLVPAVAIALFVSLGLGVALAAGDGAQSAPSELAIPAPLIGDRASYSATLSGEWRYDDKVEGQPFPLLAFEWRTGSQVRDAEGRMRDADQVRVEGLAYMPFAAEVGEGSEDQPSWIEVPLDWWYARGTGEVLASGGHQKMALQGNVSYPSPLGPVPLFDSQADFDVISHAYPLPASPLHACLVGEAWRGGTVDPSAPLALQACSLPHLYHFRGNATLAPAGFERVGPFDAARFSGEDDQGQPLSIWLADGIPYPVRYEAAQAVPQDLFEGSQGQGAFVVEMTGLEAGSQARVAGGEPGPAAPAIEYAPRQPWGMDETGAEHPFPPSKAYQVAAEQSPLFQAMLAESPGAYIANSWFMDLSSTNDVDRRWHLMVTDGSTMVSLFVRQEGTPAGAGDDWPMWNVWDKLPQVPEEGMVYDYSVEELASLPFDDLFPMPDELPQAWPTAASVVARWKHFVGPQEDASAPAWEQSVFCSGTCGLPDLLVRTGVNEHHSSTVSVQPGQQPEFLASDLTFGTLFLTGEGHTILFVDARLDSQATAAVPVTAGPASPPSSTADDGVRATSLAAFIPTVPQAAGATLLGLLLGALYWLWPKLKAAAGLGLFSRIGGEQLLEHPARAQLLQIVQAEPGVHFQDLVRRSGLPNGTAVHHLGKLAKGGLVSVRSLGRYTCYFPGNSPDRAALAAAPVLRSDGARRVYEAIQGRPGLSGLELAGLVELQPSTVNYHVQRLVESGLVRAARDGRAVRLTPATAG